MHVFQSHGPEDSREVMVQLWPSVRRWRHTAACARSLLAVYLLHWVSPVSSHQSCGGGHLPCFELYFKQQNHRCSCCGGYLVASCMWLSCDPMDCSPPGSSVPGKRRQRFSRQEYWSGLPCPPPRDLPDPGIEPVNLVSNLGLPALHADSFQDTVL